jgi:dinuclear metal center YbgI/SA1388 family protein
MQIEKLLETINAILPPTTAMKGDNIGLQLQSGKQDIKKVLLTMEVNDDVACEAIQEKCDCIITFHPLIFHPLKHIDSSDRVGRLVTKLIQNSIVLIASHTAFDAYSEGTSKILAEKLELEVVDFLVPDESIENFGMGVIAVSKNGMTEEELLEKVQRICYSPLRFNHGKDRRRIKKIAIVGGSGSSFISDARRAGVDAFITADITYHRFHEVNGEMMLIDPGHYEMEQFVGHGMLRMFEEKCKGEELPEFLISKKCTNPIKYYPDTDKYTENQKQYLLSL